MTQEYKEFLLKDLCARLPYGVICHYNCVIPCDRRLIKKANAIDVLKGIIPMSDGHIGFMVGIDEVNAIEGDIKPYLRPMSSMTEEEKKEFNKAVYDSMNIDNISSSVYVADWLYSKHLDVHGLIPKGLAIEVTEENNPYK